MKAVMLGGTVRVGEEACGVPRWHGKGRAVSAGKWEGAAAPEGSACRPGP